MKCPLSPMPVQRGKMSLIGSTIRPPPADFCLYNMGLCELDLDPDDLPPPMQREP